MGPYPKAGIHFGQTVKDISKTKQLGLKFSKEEALGNTSKSSFHSYFEYKTNQKMPTWNAIRLTY